jgi:phage FluMu protein Com
LATITKMDGVIQIEKKCSKCKSVNVVTYVNDEVRVVCKNALKNISIDY